MPRVVNVKKKKSAGGDSLSLLENLPRELLQGLIAPYLSEKDLGRLSRASKTMFFTYRESLEKKEAKTLLSHVVKGEEAESLKMIVANPKLLLSISEATDYSGRSYQKVTPFQAALLCHDTTLWKKIEPYFDKLPNGKEEKVNQFKALFPEGLPKQEPYDFNSLTQVISNSSDTDIRAALQKENNDTPICQALKNFRVTFTELAMKETVFNSLHLIKAHEVYDAQVDHWTQNQLDLLFKQVIGFTQRFLPACFAQAFCQGLYFILEENKPLLRSLPPPFARDPYYPLTDSSGVGFDFGIYAGCPFHARAFGASGDATRVTNYVEQIQQNYLDLSTACGMIDNPSRTTSVAL